MISEFKTLFSLFRTKRTAAVLYGFMFAFIALTFFLAFNPPSDSSSPWSFSNMFATSSRGSGTRTSSPSAADLSDESSRSQVSSIFSFFFPNSSEPLQNFAPPPSLNTSTRSRSDTVAPSISKNQTQNIDLHGGVNVLKPNLSTVASPKSPFPSNQTAKSVPLQSSSVQNDIAGNERNMVNRTANPALKSSPVGKNFTGNAGKRVNQAANPVPKSSPAENNFAGKEEKRVNQAAKSVPKSSSAAKNNTKNEEKKAGSSNSGSSPVEKQGNGTNAGVWVKQQSENEDSLVKSLMNCDFSDGQWVRDESYPLYKPGSCSLIDEQFNCFRNGRPDRGYDKLKWKPKGCSLPRLSGSHMLEMMKGKRLVFVGDSLNRNMWESLVCILRSSVKDQTKVYEAYGRKHFRTEASYFFVFEDYNCTVEFFASPFLVRQWEMTDKNGKKKETLRLDLIGETADQYKGADIIIFNTGHWWTHEKTSKGEDYYQEGSHVYSELNVLEAFRKALTTWGRWVDANINPMKTQVLFRGYSASHFSGGQWNSGGQCDHETEPIKNETYLTEYPPKMRVLERVFKGMKTPVSYMNVTRMTDYRKDGHPSIYRKQKLSDEERRSPLMFQDCSHWCLPGVPDAWNELLYAEILRNHKRKQQNRKRP
ncbi:hypothetical protein NMG60_11001863 [Bertholletia excelsa]